LTSAADYSSFSIYARALSASCSKFRKIENVAASGPKPVLTTFVISWQTPCLAGVLRPGLRRDDELSDRKQTHASSDEVRRSSFQMSQSPTLLGTTSVPQSFLGNVV